jgi:Zn-dependent protease
MNTAQIAELAIWFPAFLLSITLHEAAHAFVAVWGGDDTPEEQASLNPLPHIAREPVGTLLAPLLSFFAFGYTLGWASAPYDRFWADRHPRRAALMSLAGPLANFLLAGLALGALHALLAAGVLQPNPGKITFSTLVLPASEGPLGFVAQFLSVTFLLNLILGCFNLIPLPPLDGSGVIQGLLPNTAIGKGLAMLEERGWSMIGLLLAWLIFPKTLPWIWALVQVSLGL